jgi:hypothetical protein
VPGVVKEIPNRHTGIEEMHMSTLELIAHVTDVESNNGWVPIEAVELTPNGPGRVTPNDSFDKRCGC